ncbi:ferric reductase-like transmembrane domain-containing protein, partial [Diaphorobacter sp.]|uniref:ferric reductase-like transmembrane domain-containing protein n=1 Tax=Diaphorobacter sp. TaxID=1934310 RepID=UPI0025872C85
MRIKIVLGGWLLAITLAWLAVLPPELGVSPLVDAQGAATGWWQLRQQALYLSGLWSIGLMALAMVLALRLPWLERPLGGMDQVYRLHKWAGISAALTAVLHWGADESSDWIKGLWGRAGPPAGDTVITGLTAPPGVCHDRGEVG